jgi:hypothetical protein
MKRVNLLSLLMVVSFTWIGPALAQSDVQQWFMSHMTADWIPGGNNIDEDNAVAINNIHPGPTWGRPYWLAYNGGELPKEFGPLRMASHAEFEPVLWPYSHGRTIFKFRKNPANPPGPVTFGESVAILLDYHGSARGWLYFSHRSQKVQFSFGPHYEWALTGGPTGTIVKTHWENIFPAPPHDIIGIYNAVRQDHIIYCEQNSTGLGWAPDCQE